MTSCIKFLCCGCFGDNKEPSLKREDHKSPLLNSATQIQPHNSYQRGGSSFTAHPQQEDMQRTGEKVGQLVGSDFTPSPQQGNEQRTGENVDQLVGSGHFVAPLESSFTTPPHSPHSSPKLTPHQSPGSLNSSTEDIPFNWQEHATDHKSPEKKHIDD